MSFWIDKKYIQLLAPQLQKFKQKKEDLWNFRCPFCGDSEKNTVKARGYIFIDENAYLFKCHNCQYSTNLHQLIKTVDLSLYREYVLERFNNQSVSWKNQQPPKEVKPVDNLTIIDGIIESIEALPIGHWLIGYIKWRKIPTKFWADLYYAPDYKQFVDKIMPSHDKELLHNDPRLVIPFYDENRDLTGFQGRTLNGNKIKYITIKISDEALKVYGIDKVKKDQSIQVVEGPIDSMFLENGVATCDSDLSRAAKYLPKEKLVLIWDNQYHNKEVHRLVTRAINDGFQVCIWPKTYKEKDINDMVINGMTIEDVTTVIRENTFSGLKAKLELSNRCQ